jgi:hypothetical protein
MNFGEDRKFGIVLVLVLTVLGGVFHWQGYAGVSCGVWLLALSALVILCISPAMMKYPRKALLTVGWLNSQLVLLLVFYLVLTPTGLVMRLLGRDFLNRKEKDKRESYWIPREPVDFDPNRLERPY